MRARVQLVREVVAEHSLQPRRVGDYDVVEALTSDRPDHTLDISIPSPTDCEEVRRLMNV